MSTWDDDSGLSNKKDALITELTEESDELRYDLGIAKELLAELTVEVARLSAGHEEIMIIVEELLSGHPDEAMYDHIQREDWATRLTNAISGENNEAPSICK
jgi:hypothetical protein